MKAYIIKYALTKGIIECEATINENDKNSIETRLNNMRVTFWTEGKEWVKTKEEAIKIAEEMKTNKIQKLQIQIAKLRSKDIDFKKIENGKIIDIE